MLRHFFVAAVMVLSSSCSAHDEIRSTAGVSLQCTEFQEFTGVHPLSYVLENKKVCSEIFFSENQGVIRRLDYATQDDRDLPVIVTSPINAPVADILYIHGGPRGVQHIGGNALIDSLAEKGFRVIAPVFFGSAVTSHPGSDFEFAKRELSEIIKASSPDGTIIVAESAGATLVGAVCADDCAAERIIFVAPLISSPGDHYRDRVRLSPSAGNQVVCLTHHLTRSKVCIDELAASKSYWGDDLNIGFHPNNEMMSLDRACVIVGDQDDISLNSRARLIIEEFGAMPHVIAGEDHYSLLASRVVQKMVKDIAFTGICR